MKKIYQFLEDRRIMMSKFDYLELIIDTYCEIDQFIRNHRDDLTNREFDLLCDVHNLLIDFDRIVSKEEEELQD